MHTPTFGSELLRRSTAGTDPSTSPITHVSVIGSRAATFADWPEWVPADLVAAFGADGIDKPWVHQVAAAEHAFNGKHVALCTGTASGKSLAYQLPIVSTLLKDRTVVLRTEVAVQN